MWKYIYDSMNNNNKKDQDKCMTAGKSSLVEMKGSEGDNSR
jgi:hypothetical protein